MSEAAQVQQEVLEKRRHPRDEDPDTISAMNDLAATLREQGKPYVLQLWKAVLGLRESKLAEHHHRPLASPRLLAHLCQTIEQTSTAISLNL